MVVTTLFILLSFLSPSRRDFLASIKFKFYIIYIEVRSFESCSARHAAARSSTKRGALLDMAVQGDALRCSGALVALASRNIFANEPIAPGRA